MAANYGGYDYNFVEKDHEEFTCNICTKVLRDPHLTGCCGQHFCESCLNYWFTKHRKESCPHCRAEGEEFTHILDKKLDRKIRSLKIFCPNKEEGCQWEGVVGTLKDHLESDNGCGYVEVGCSYKCKALLSDEIVRKVKRNELEIHLKNDCYLRPYQCEHCGHKDTYLNITGHNGMVQAHYAKCPEFPLTCTNYKCGQKGIKRKDMENHNRQCLVEKVDCPNRCKMTKIIAKASKSSLGISSVRIKQLKRKNIEKHLKNKCYRRPYQCEHCGHKDTYEAITGIGFIKSEYCHYSRCPEFPLECPNKCGAKDIKRKDVKDHRSQCPEELVQCLNKCAARNPDLYRSGYAYKYEHVKRKNLDMHLKEECVLRPYQCEHCVLKDTYTAVSEHYKQCPEFPLECPNKCGVKDIKRKDMEDHRSQCPEEPVQCPFEEAGCKEKLVRRELEQHTLPSVQLQKHLLMIMGAYKEMKKKLEDNNIL